MPHPYPPRLSGFSYVGRYSYSLEFTTDGRRTTFVEGSVVRLVLQQILRAGAEERFSIITYCFMPDHLHLIVEGLGDDSDCKAYIQAAKQFSGYYFKQAMGRRLWERYGYDRVIRDDMERALTIRYLLANPVRAGLVDHPALYPFLGSQRYTVDELLQICEYSDVTPWD
jgi:putative transposase